MCYLRINYTEEDLIHFLRCLGKEETEKVVAQVHKGICRVHQTGIKMRWLLRRYSYY